MTENVPHYRLVDQRESEGVTVRLVVFRVIKETPKGYWVASQYAPCGLSLGGMRKRKFAKWVSKSSRKRYCYPSIEEAIRSFKLRKEAQASQLRRQFEQAELVTTQSVLFDGASVEELREGIHLGHTESSRSIVWDW